LGDLLRQWAAYEFIKKMEQQGKERGEILSAQMRKERMHKS
jgi:hypothetical protein